MDYINCEKAGFSFTSILQSLFAYDGDSATKSTGIRVIFHEDTYTFLPECDRFETWTDLFREALDVGVDGLPLLRVVTDSISITAPDCEDWQTTENLMKMSFVKLDSTGDVAILLLSEGVS